MEAKTLHTLRLLKGLLVVNFRAPKLVEVHVSWIEYLVILLNLNGSFDPVPVLVEDRHFALDRALYFMLTFYCLRPSVDLCIFYNTKDKLANHPLG